MFFQQSPEGRLIEELEGNPEDIIKRGDAIFSLGNKMTSSATKLAQIKDNALSDGTQQGKAIEKLQESVGDSHTVLAKAGHLYTPVGPFITGYGEALEVLQPRIKGIVEECEQRWNHYLTLDGDKGGNTTPEAGGGFLGMGGHDADSEEAKQEAEDNAEKAAAYDHYILAADAFDDAYDSWEQAFDDAAKGIEDEMTDGIKDSVWSTLTDVLEIAALVVGIAAIIIGGPLLAALAMVLAVALLITTIKAYENGERNKTDIGLAIVGVIPVTKLSSVTKMLQTTQGASKMSVAKNVLGIDSLAKFGDAGSDLLKNGKILRSGSGGLIDTFQSKGAAQGFRQLMFGSTKGSIDDVHAGFFKGTGITAADLADNKFVQNMIKADIGITGLATVARNYGYVDKAPGFDVPDIPKLVGFGL